MTSTAAELRVLHDPDQIKVLMDPARRRLLDALQERPDSAVGLARRLGDSRQRLNYHLGLLEEAGLVELAEARPRRGVTERVLRVTARGFVVDPGALGSLAPAEPEEVDRFSATWLVALGARLIRELGGLMHRAGRSGKRLPTAGISTVVRLADPADFDPLVEDLSRAVADVVARYHTDGGEGRTFRIVAGTYPAPDEAVDDSGTGGSAPASDPHQEE